ncbi:OmpA family protein [Pelomonas cellulosilytica]|uniref:OmpA family protein n=1 Tax=Pelomonas cellulosilytica TaxID=2906762 RepID=A0ABS8XR80_9BURK|nr:OmpA family protein [Pelomonas sp. P8]MCE4553407.1 OmpA family protein [Pelomonas sp. P8]
MRTTATLTALAAAAALMAGCASAPTVTPGLTQARSTVRSAEADPAVLKYAALDVKKASESLKRAEQLSADRAAPADIDSAAYVASTQARTAMALAKAQTDEDAIKTAEADRERARADANAARARNAQAQAADAQIAAANANADAVAARQQAATAQAQAADLQRELQDLQARQTDRGMLVTLGDVLFEFGRADIKPAAQGAITKLAHYLNQHPDRRVLIEGFTDSVGSDQANLTLSQRRSQAVADALRAQGVDPSRVDTRGYGEAYPVASNSSSSDRAMNRRVEVYISNDNQPVRARG